MAKAPAANELTAEDRQDLVKALMLWRYFEHQDKQAMPGTLERVNRALVLARKIGLGKEFLDAVFNEPVQCVTLSRNLE
jgi:uncharacterized protein YeaC (DUF1315 family)